MDRAGAYAPARFFAVELFSALGRKVGDGVEIVDFLEVSYIIMVYYAGF